MNPARKVARSAADPQGGTDMAGTDIPTGVTTAHGDVVVTLHDGPGITATAAVTQVVPNLPDNRFDPAAQGDVMPTTAMFGEQAAAGTADCAAAMSLGMDARTSMLAHYESDILPAGAAYGDLMDFPAAPLDPGAGVGNTLPTAAFFDPPRGYGGAEGAPGYQGNEPPPGIRGKRSKGWTCTRCRARSSRNRLTPGGRGWSAAGPRRSVRCWSEGGWRWKPKTRPRPPGATR
jgi:hypothetical protein